MDTPNQKNRLDVEMAVRGLAKSRSLAQDLIKRGEVAVNGKIASKASAEVGAADEIIVRNPLRFVSRAGDKLEGALAAWDIPVSGIAAIDIGSSTGGFTDCLLKRGASKVIAVDVGTDQLDASLRDDPRVELHESTDIRRFSLPSPVDMAVIDVSFISLALVLPKAYESLKKGGCAIALVKPQFEVGRETAQKHKGVIRDDAKRAETLESIRRIAAEIGFEPAQSMDSPIEGENGNREFLLLLKKN